MAGVVKFTLDAEDQKAVSAFMRVVDAQKKTERGLKKISKSGKQTTSTMGGLGKSIMGLTGGLIGAAGLKMAFGALTQGMEEISGKTVQFEDKLTALLHLGKNVENIEAVKDAVLDMSGAFGYAIPEVTAAMFSLESGASDLTKETRDKLLKESIMLNKVTGATLPTSLKVLMKTFRIYGKELGTITNASNKLVKIEQEAEITFEEMGTYMPDVMAAAKTFGYSIDDIGAALIVMTKELGRSERTMTAARNIFLRFTNAGKLGIKLTGDFVKDLEILAEVSSQELKKLFGDEAIAGIGVLTSNIDNVKKAHETLKISQDSITKDIYTTRLKDQAFRYSEIAKSIKMMNENLALSGKYIETTGRVTQEKGMREFGIKEEMGPWAGLVGGLARPLAWMETLNAELDRVLFEPFRTERQRARKPAYGVDFLERGRGAFLEVQERAGAEGTILGRQQRERWEMEPTETGKLDTAAEKIAKAADKISTTMDKTDKAMDRVSRGISSRN